jgi:hypothetical protein
MKRLIMLIGMLAAFGLGGAAAYAATSEKPPTPPGQPQCEHGNSQAECKDDPQPDHGQECKEHGKLGGQNEDHCKTETTPTETTPTDTTPTDTTPTDTTPTTPTTTTPAGTPSSDTPSSPSSPSEPSSPAATDEPAATETTSSPQAEQEPQVYTPPTAPNSKPAKQNAAAVAAVSTSAPAPTRAAQQAPFTP